MNPRHSATRYLDVAAAPSFGKSAFLPQAAAVLVAGAALSSDVPFALFIQTLAFVALNKVYENASLFCFSFRRFISHTHCCVCSYTVQYFVWFFSFLPLALSRLPLHHNPRPRNLVSSLLVAGKPSADFSRGPHIAPAQLSRGQQHRGRG